MWFYSLRNRNFVIECIFSGIDVRQTNTHTRFAIALVELYIQCGSAKDGRRTRNILQIRKEPPKIASCKQLSTTAMFESLHRRMQCQFHKIHIATDQNRRITIGFKNPRYLQHSFNSTNQSKPWKSVSFLWCLWRLSLHPCGVYAMESWRTARPPNWIFSIRTSRSMNCTFKAENFDTEVSARTTMSWNETGPLGRLQRRFPERSRWRAPSLPSCLFVLLLGS